MPPSPQRTDSEDPSFARRYATERRRQLWVLWLLAAIVLVVSVLRTGIHNIFLPGWWRIDLP